MSCSETACSRASMSVGAFSLVVLHMAVDSSSSLGGQDAAAAVSGGVPECSHLVGALILTGAGRLPQLSAPARPHRHRDGTDGNLCTPFLSQPWQRVRSAPSCMPRVTSAAELRLEQRRAIVVSSSEFKRGGRLFAGRCTKCTYVLKVSRIANWDSVQQSRVGENRRASRSLSRAQTANRACRDPNRVCYSMWRLLAAWKTCRACPHALEPGLVY